jgi:hypothetical protein
MPKPSEEQTSAKPTLRHQIVVMQWRSTLTDHDHELLQRYAQGQTLAAIAAATNVSTKTVGRKLDAWVRTCMLQTRSQLVALYVAQFPERCHALPPTMRTKPHTPVTRFAAQVLPEAPMTENKSVTDSTVDIAHTTGVVKSAAHELRSLTQRLLNPVLWKRVIIEHRALRAHPTLLDSHRSEYHAVSTALRLLDDAPAQPPSLDTLERGLQTDSDVYLPLLLSLRWLGSPMTATPTPMELDHEADYGWSQRRRWLNEQRFQMDLTEGLYDRAAGLARWAEFSAALRQRNRSDPPAPRFTAREHLCPLIGLTAWVNAKFQELRGTDEQVHEWTDEVRRIASTRALFIEQLGLTPATFVTTTELV